MKLPLLRWLLCIVLVFPAMANAQTESEPNNSIGQSDPLTHMSDISGETGSSCVSSDNSADYFIINPPFRGMMKIRTLMSTDQAATTTITIDVLNSSAGIDASFDAQVGGNNVPIADSLMILCQGVGTYYIRVTAGGAQCVNYTLSYEMSAPVFVDDMESNSSFGAADTALSGMDHEGTIDFQYGDNADYYRLVLPDDGQLNLHTEAEHTDVSTTDSLTLTLHNNGGGILRTWRVPVGSNSIVASTDVNMECRGNENFYYFRIVSDVCGASYLFNYNVTSPVYADDIESNDSFSTADTVAIDSVAQGRLSFYYDDNVDYYRIVLNDDGVMNLHFDAAHTSSSTTDSVAVRLFNNSGSTLQEWRIPIGASSTPAHTDIAFAECLGNENLYYIRFISDACGSSYQFSYDVTNPVYADDIESNDSFSVADTVAIDSVAQGRLDFLYDDNADYYRIVLNDDGVMNLHFDAEHTSSSTTDSVEVRLFNSSGSTLQAWRIPIGASSTPAHTDIAFAECLGNENLYYIRFISDACGSSYQFSYDVTNPVYADDVESNNNFSTADTVASDSIVQGRLDFLYDDNADYYRIVLNDDGVMNLHFDSEHTSSSTTDSIEVRLFNSSGSTLRTWRVPIGASSTPAHKEINEPCFGNETLYYVRFISDGCGTSYQFSYDVSPPVFSDDVGNNNSSSAPGVVTIDTEMTSVEGRLNFHYDDNIDYYRVILPSDGMITINSRAENVGSVGAFTIDLLNASLSQLETHSLPVGGASTPAMGTFTSALLSAGTYYLRVENAPCGTSYIFDCNDDDNDGTCNFFDLCPGGPEPGTPCDDGTACTTNDVIQSDCSCAGTPVDPDDGNACTTDSCDPILGVINAAIDPDDGDPCTLDSCDPITGVSNIFQDSDNDGTCDANDLCPSGPEPGTVCDDSDATTGNDVILSDCSCAGQLIDCEGVIGGSALPGTSCDDADPNTSNDVYDANCNCGGQALDCEGVPGGTALPGTACDDGDATTGNDVYDANCNCIGQLIDCEGTAGGTALPGTACDDGDPNTSNDVYDTNCNCGGQALDCEGVPGGTALPGTACDDGDATTGNDVYDANCNCAGQLIDCEGTAGGTALPGTACDDGDPNTSNDVYDANCNCAGQALDCEGVPGGSALPGSPCDDGDVTTGNDVYLGDCTCVGQVIDCEGLAGGTALPGTACDDSDPNTTGDVYDANCNCAGTPIGTGTNNLSLVISTDDNGNETSWEILPAGSSTAVCSGSGYPDNQVSVENCNVADGCYELRVYDSMGDGMFSGTMGGYVLHDQFGAVLIDNEGDGQFGALSAITNNNTFCVPMGSDKLRFADCGKLDLLPSDFIIATNNPAVAAEYGVGAQNDDGFQYWVFDPDGTYSRFIFLSHANHSIGAPSGAYAVNHLNLTSMASSPVPVNIKLNVKIRSRVNGVNSAFGPACVIMIDVAAAGCPMTNLVDDPSSPFFACGVSKTFGGSDKVRAIPVPGANKYQFRFENLSEGYLRHIAFPSYTCKLRWGTLPLSIGVSYDVQVRVSYDSGANYCPWGAVCSVTIVPPPMVSSRALENEVHSSISVYPNPSDGSFINLMISISDEEIQKAQVRITDMSGKMVHSSQFTVYQRGQRESLELDHSLSKGAYLLHIRIGDDLFIENLIVN